MTGPRSEERTAYRALFEGSEAGPVRLPMLTGSMSPEILPGDVLVIEPASGGRVHLGDVAVFFSRGKLTAHRILLVVGFGRRRWYLEKGDLNPTAGWIDDRAVWGRVTAFVRDGREKLLPRGRQTASAVLRERRRLVYYSLLRRRYGK